MAGPPSEKTELNGLERSTFFSDGAGPGLGRLTQLLHKSENMGCTALPIKLGLVSQEVWC